MGLGSDSAATIPRAREGVLFTVCSTVCEIFAAKPRKKDAVDGPEGIEYLARVTARIGESDRAITALQKLLSIPYEAPLALNVPLTPALPRLGPMFDPLRNDPRFQKLAAPDQK